MNKIKKGIALQQAFPAVLIVLLLGVLVIVAVVMFNSLSTATPLVSLTTTNESSFINQSGDQINNASACGFTNPQIITVYNATDSSVISSGNYTFVGSTGVITNATSRVWPTTLVTYSFQWNGPTCVSSQNMTTQFVSYVALVGLVGVIIFLGIVIGTLIVSFMTSKRGV